MSAWPSIASILSAHPAVYLYESQISKFYVHRLNTWSERILVLAQMSY